MKRHVINIVMSSIALAIALIAGETVPAFAEEIEIAEDIIEVSAEDNTEDIAEEITEEISDVSEEDSYEDLSADCIESGILGDAVYVDEFGNLVICTEGFAGSGNEYSDEQILEAVEDALSLTADSGLTTIKFNVSYSQSDARGMLGKVNSLRTNPSTAWQRKPDGSKENITGLSALSYDYELEKAAMLRAAEVALSFSHTRPNGGTCFTAYSDVFSSGWKGENIAAGYSSAAAVMEGWAETNEPYNGQGHRRNMLSRNFTTIGIGHCIFNGYDYWTQEFSSIQSGLPQTAAASGNRTVTTTVSTSRMSSKSVLLKPASGTVVEGESFSLPKVAISFSIRDAWPEALQMSSSISPDWELSDETDEPYATIDLENGKIILSSDSAKGCESRVIKLKAIIENTVKYFPLTVKCKHEMENTITPATLYSDGIQGGICRKCGHPETIVISRVNTFALSPSSAVFDGTDKTPKLTVKDAKGKVIPEENYTMTICDKTGGEVYPGAGCIYPGTYKVNIIFNGTKYTGKKTMDFTILPKSLTSKDILVTVEQNYVFLGRRVEHAVTVTDKTTGYTLIEDSDYVLEYANNTSVGKAAITIIGIGNYAGTIAKQATIIPAVFGTSDISITAADSTRKNGSDVAADGGACLNYSYTGKQIKPEVSITVMVPEPYELKEGIDFTVAYAKSNLNVYLPVKGDETFDAKKSPALTITGINNFKSAGKITYTFPISGDSLKNCSVDSVVLEYTKKAQKPIPVLYGKEGNLLKNKNDYIISGYCKAHEPATDAEDYNLETESVIPLEPGNYVIILSGQKNYSGSMLAVPLTIADAEVKAMSKLSYSLPKVSFTLGVPAVPSEDKVLVKAGKTVYNGFRYTPGEDEQNLNTSALIQKALESYQNALTTAQSGTDEDEISHLQAMNYVYFCCDFSAVGNGKVIYAAIPGHGLIGTYSKTYQITGIPISKAKPQNFVSSMVYDGTFKKQNFEMQYTQKGADPVILHYDEADPENSDYTVTYSYAKSVNVGTVTVFITGNPKRGYSGSVKKTFKVTPKKLTVDELLSADSQIRINGQNPYMGLGTLAYTGAVVTPRPVIEYGPKGFSDALRLRCGEDYTLSYSNNIKRASSTDKKCPMVIVKAKGNYSGSMKLLFNISNEDGENSLFVKADANKKVIADGSLMKPFLTVQEAVNASNPGDTIYVRGGTYKESIFFDENSSGNATDGDITLTNFPGEKVSLTAVAKSDVPIITIKEGAHNITISNLYIGNYSSLWAYGILMEIKGNGSDSSTKGISDITVKDNDFAKLKTTNPKADGGGANAVLLSGGGDSSTTEARAIKNIVISGNSVHDNVNGWSENISVTGNCSDIIIDGNRVYNNTNIGIDLYGNNDGEAYCQNSALNHPRKCTVSNNVVYKCKSKYAECAGIYVDGAYGDSWDNGIKITGNEVYNNQYGIEVGSEEWRTYYDTGSGTDAQGNDHHVRFITVSNNYVHNNPSGGIRIGGYSDAPENPLSEEQATGIVMDSKIINNYLTDNGTGSAGYNGEIHFSKCKLNKIVCDGNTITQGKLNKKYPQIVYEENLVIR